MPNRTKYSSWHFTKGFEYFVRDRRDSCHPKRLSGMAGVGQSLPANRFKSRFVGILAWTIHQDYFRAANFNLPAFLTACVTGM
jgi:hypothetical protein